MEITKETIPSIDMPSNDSNAIGKREDFFLSVCFVGEKMIGEELDVLNKVIDQLEVQFKYWEVLYVVPESLRTEYKKYGTRIATFRNFRIIFVNDEVGYYQRRKIAASEALGDVTILTAVNEITKIDILAFAVRAYIKNTIVIGERKIGLFNISPSHAFLRAISAHNVSLKYLKTTALPRLPLNIILQRTSSALDLRYPPKKGGLKYLSHVFEPDIEARHAPLLPRLHLSLELILNSSERFLRAYAMFSALVMFAAILYGIYAILILTFANPSAGWFSTSIIQAGSTFFIAGGMGVLSLGFVNLTAQSRRQSEYEIVDELSNLDFFRHTKDLNVVEEEPDQGKIEND